MADYYTETNIDTLILIDTQYWNNGSTLLGFNNGGFSCLGHCIITGVLTVYQILRINGYMEAFTLNVGRGDVYFENNAYDNAGAGVTIRSSANPSTGSMFAVRSSGRDARLWVGQSITTPGANDFYAEYSGSSGDEGTKSSYKHKLTITIAQFGTVTT